MKKVQWRIPGCLFFDNTWKNFKSNLVLVLVLFLESKGLYKHYLRAGSSPFRAAARSHTRVARERRRERERLCCSLACSLARPLARSLAVGFAHHIKINGEVARRLHLHGQTGGYTVGQMVRKIRTGKFRPESRLPFVQISSIYRKTAAKAWNWYQRWLWRNGTWISIRQLTELPFQMFPSPAPHPFTLYKTLLRTSPHLG